MKLRIYYALLTILIMSAGCSANEATGMAGTAVVLADDDGVQAEAAQSGVCMSSFTTAYNAKSKNRASNIQLAAETIDGSVILPGETFSFNDAVGPTTRENGYKLATVFFNREEAKGYGGGVCQVSTTLFNAAEMAGLSITERHTHSLDVTYVEKGRDATTSRKGNLDLKIANPNPYPVVIRANAGGGQVVVEIHTA